MLKDNSSSNSNIFIKLYVQAFRNGIYNDLDGGAFKTLMMLATYQNEKGECFPSQAELAKRLGITEATVCRHIGKLVEYKLPGNAVIFEKSKKKGKRKSYYYSYYKFSIESGLRFGNEGKAVQNHMT